MLRRLLLKVLLVSASFTVASAAWADTRPLRIGFQTGDINVLLMYAMQSGQFTGWSPTWMLGRRIHGKRLGIIGMGRIGTAVARRRRPARCPAAAP